MSSEPTVIYSAASAQQAHLLRGLLEERGIKAVVVNDAIQIAGGELPVGWTAAPQVVVAKEHAVAARQLAEELDRPRRRVPGDSDADDGGVELDWPDWPRCPACETRRSARCPVCQTTSTDFPLADYQAPDAGDRLLLVCATCDDHMRPEWYRLCANCGHDFESGIAPPQSSFPDIPWDPLFLWVGLSVLVAALVATGYFFWLFG